MPKQESTPDTEQTIEPADFLAFLTNVQKGRTVRECSEKLQQLVAAVVATRKSGTLTLKITVKPANKADALTVSDDVTVKEPQFDRDDSLFFADPNHNLVRNPPNQSELF